MMIITVFVVVVVVVVFLIYRLVICLAYLGLTFFKVLS